jgi:hypothetical protein
MPTARGRLCAVICPVLLAAGLSACGTTPSSNAFKGEEQAVAQTIANFRSDATAGERHKICTEDLATAVVVRLGPAPAGCEAAMKTQLAEVDSFELTVQHVHLLTAGARPTATATVQSLYSGKKGTSTLSLVKEAGKWKISSLG